MTAGVPEHDVQSLRARRSLLTNGVAALTCALVAAACSTGSPASPEQQSSEFAPSSRSSFQAVPDLAIDSAGTAVTFDRRLLGTNLPAWLGPERLSDETFRDAATDSGTTLVRMPGGSWSNAYDWHACETGDPDGCYWLAAARPTDFIEFLQSTGLDGMWTVSINESAQQAAAAVAFFNGSVDDDTRIGVDRYGEDWATVGTWAALRAENGNPEPLGISLWEVGNEVYGGRPDAGGEECAGFGWEDVWTCDGTEYINGDVDHDGFLAIRAAMLAVDPDIQVGAVGVGEPDAWSNWGNEVIAEAGDALDFYVVHQYGFDESPGAEEAIARPAEMWPELLTDVRDALGADTPIAVTEYNLVSVNDNDPDRTMIQAMNALYIADTIGQLALRGVAIANQWNLANGLAANGTDYGLVDVDEFAPYPQFEALARWSAVGSDIYPTTGVDDQLRVYATRHADASWTILILNLSDTDVTRTLGFADDLAASSAVVDSASADDPRDTALQVGPPLGVAFVDGVLSVELPAWSISTVSISPDDTTEVLTDD